MFLIVGGFLLATVLISQFRDKPLTGRLYRQPMALLFCAVCSLSFMHALSFADWFTLFITFFFSFALGLLQGRFTPLLQRDGTWYLAGSAMSVLIWFTSIPVRLFLRFISINYLSSTPSFAGADSFIVYFIFVSGFLFGRYGILMLRYPAFLKQVSRNEEKIRKLQQGEHSL